MSKFKVGDKVRAVDQSNGWAWVRKGDEGVVAGFRKHPTDDTTLVIVDFPLHKGWRGQEHCFELIEYHSKWHKHHDYIVAWAKGASIQVKVTFEDCIDWVNDTNPDWYDFLEYRIKPEKSEKDLRIEEIQKKMCELNDELEKLKGE